MADHTHPEHPTALIPDLLKLFYSLGWVTGTGGGLSVKHEYSSPPAEPVLSPLSFFNQ